MGKRIISRARGKGGPTYRSPGHRFAGAIGYPVSGTGKIVDIIHDVARDAPLAVLQMADKKEFLVVAAEGSKVGDTVDINNGERLGNIIELQNVTKGNSVFSIETHPQSGPKLCNSAGTRATVIDKTPTKVILQMPSRMFKSVNPACKATIGVPAGGGQRDKPIMRAGNAFHAEKARNKMWPRSSSGKMNAVDHPFGGRTKPGWPKSTSRNAPPGAKVGSIASSRTGRRKK